MTTPHSQPSDWSRFEVNTAADNAGETAQRFHGTLLIDGFFGDGTTPHPINDPASNGYAHTKGTGKLNALRAIGWAFGAYKDNMKLWLVIGAVIAVLGVLSQIPALAMLGLGFSLARLLLDPLFTSAGLQQTLSKNVVKPKAPNYGAALGVLVVNRIIVGAIAVVLIAIAMIITLMATGFDPSKYLDPAAVQADPELMDALTRDIAPGIIAAGLIIVLIMPFAIYPVFYASDNAGSFGFSLGQGMKAGGRTYLHTIVLVLFTAVILFISALPIRLIDWAGLNPWVAAVLSFLLTALLFPLTFLSQAHAYRQVSGGPVPHEAAADTL